MEVFEGLKGTLDAFEVLGRLMGGIAQHRTELSGIGQICIKMLRRRLARLSAELRGIARDCAELRGIARNVLHVFLFFSIAFLVYFSNFGALRGIARNCAEPRAPSVGLRAGLRGIL